MQWLESIADQAIARKPDEGDEIIVSSGISPSGGYHMGYLREIIICDAIARALARRGRRVRHLHFVDDQDGFRKVPAGLPEQYQKYLGKPLWDIPAPDGSGLSYADYSLADFSGAVEKLGITMEVIRSHEQYQSGRFSGAVELVLRRVKEVRQVLQDISGRRLDENWSPIQVNEEGYLKKRRFVDIDVSAKTITYEDKEGLPQSISYQKGGVKLDWRLDWPARWWLFGVDIEPFGRDHATKGGSYDTGAALSHKIFESPPPIPVPYNFVNRAGDSKKMSASKGNGILMSEVVDVLPPEICRYFILRTGPQKPLFFDPQSGVAKLVDEFAELLLDQPRSPVIYYSQNGIKDLVISSIPFSLLAESYQAALKNVELTLQLISRTEYGDKVAQNRETVIKELRYIDQWLAKWAPPEAKFELRKSARAEDFSSEEISYFAKLAAKIEKAPDGADGEWFHKCIYSFKEVGEVDPELLFKPLYRLLIGRESGPRAGWFLSILPRDWLVKRLKLEA